MSQTSEDRFSHDRAHMIMCRHNGCRNSPYHTSNSCDVPLQAPALELAVSAAFKIFKILNFRNSNVQTCRMPSKINNFMFDEWLIVLR